MEGRAGQGTAGWRSSFCFHFPPHCSSLERGRPSVVRPSCRCLPPPRWQVRPYITPFKGQIDNATSWRSARTRVRVHSLTLLSLPHLSRLFRTGGGRRSGELFLGQTRDGGTYGRGRDRRRQKSQATFRHAPGKYSGGCVLQTDRSSRRLDVNTICLPAPKPKLSVASCPSLVPAASHFQLFLPGAQVNELEFSVRGGGVKG